MQGCTPYGATNSYLANLTTNALGNKMILCTRCHSNINKPPNCDIQFTNKYEIHCYSQSSTCLIDVSPWHWMHIQSKDQGFNTSKIVGTSLFNRPLLGCEARWKSIEDLASTLNPLLSRNLDINLSIQTYMRIVE